MTERILLVDDEPLLLNSYQRTLRHQFSFDLASSGPEALERVSSGKEYAAVLSDLRMPEMDGLELLRRIHDISPDTVRVILTGNADLRTAIDAVNDGNIFRFLEKPCLNDALVTVLTSAVRQYRLVVSEKDILERTLHGTIKVLNEVLELINPEASSVASRVTSYVKHMAGVLHLQESWQFEVAAMLSQVGAVVLSQDTRGDAHPEVAFELIRKIPRLEVIAGMVRRQQEPFAGQGQVSIQEADQESLGAQILKVCVAFDMLVLSGSSSRRAVEALLRKPQEYNPALAAPLSTFMVSLPPYEVRFLSVDELMSQMVLDEEVRTTNGALLVAKGVEITDPLLARLRNFHQRRAIPDSIRVLVPIHRPSAISLESVKNGRTKPPGLVVRA
jgi:response regulator RpfG family c-di-GMP phosphodiesterase